MPSTKRMLLGRATSQSLRTFFRVMHLRSSLSVIPIAVGVFRGSVFRRKPRIHRKRIRRKALTSSCIDSSKCPNEKKNDTSGVAKTIVKTRRDF
jgi:hypothetical protein